MKQIIILITGLVLFSACQQAEETKSAEQEALDRLAEEHRLFRPGYADSVNLGLIEDEVFKGSARREAKAVVGGANFTINYGSPGKRGRVLWNGLVSYDQVWVSGSHWATAVSFDKAIKVAETTIPPGMYAFFTIPGREEWTLIVNKNYDQHLAELYQAAEDLVRINVKPDTLDSVVQRLTYTVEETASNQGSLTLSWDELSVSMPFEVL